MNIKVLILAIIGLIVAGFYDSSRPHYEVQ